MMSKISMSLRISRYITIDLDVPKNSEGLDLKQWCCDQIDVALENMTDIEVSSPEMEEGAPIMVCGVNGPGNTYIFPDEQSKEWKASIVKKLKSFPKVLAILEAPDG